MAGAWGSEGAVSAGVFGSNEGVGASGAGFAITGSFASELVSPAVGMAGLAGSGLGSGALLGSSAAGGSVGVGGSGSAGGSVSALGWLVAVLSGSWLAVLGWGVVFGALGSGAAVASGSGSASATGCSPLSRARSVGDSRGRSQAG